jgi:hypothetical protein
MPDKLEFTKSLTAQFTIWTVDDAMQSWWQNPNGGWRLTPVGLDAFIQLELEHWDFETPKLMPTPGLLLTLDRHLTSPYYIKVGKNPRLCFFNSKEATMYALYQDVKRFVASLQRY